ncbi:MAG: glycine--tRNA ligase subunit beta, partial [Rickettsiales bacterium]|nr:glycine--tRNA ligase subunit beta [Rickettsiales bacterium]
MAELILELLSEEIPARMQVPMAEELRRRFEAAVKTAELYHSKIETYVTPRRLVLFADGFSLTQENKMEERRGPRVDAPEKAIEGFVRSTGLKKSQLVTKKTDKGEFYFAMIEQKGKPTREVLQSILEEILPALTWPKSMRWGAYSMRWVRPLTNLCCVFGGETLPLVFGHITSNNQSFGHRFLGPKAFTVKQFMAYQETLRKQHVILSTEERKWIIREEAIALAKSKRFKLEEDEGLLDEVAGLVEWPHVLMGTIEKHYMEVPEEVLISAIRTHQKYFVLRDSNGNLAPHFLVVSNMDKDPKGAIVAGNERVLRARLADASFFFTHDQKISLENRAEKLARIVFHARLGTVEEKMLRLKATAKFLAVWVPHADLDMVDRASRLCKSDLTTEMVGEFPELQGIMGYYYAQAAGEPDAIAQAI